MALNLGKHLKKFRDDEDGWVSPFNLFMSVGLLAFGGVAFEYADVVRQKNYLQSASDAVALAALYELPDQSAALEAGLEVAAKYFPAEDTLTTITANDIDLGTWDNDASSFSETTSSPTAVRVLAGRSEGKGNMLVSPFGGLTRNIGYDVTTASIASQRSTIANACTNGGLLSDSWFYANNNNEYVAGFCTYGRYGMEIGNNNAYASDNSIQGGSAASFLQGSSNTCAGTATCAMNTAAAAEDEPTLSLPDETASLYAALSAGDTSVVKDGSLYTVRYVSQMPKRNKVVPFSLYVVTGDAEFSSNGSYEDLIVVASGEIKAGSNTSFEDVVFVTNDDITFGANTDFGSTDYCVGGRYQVYLFSGSNIRMGSNNDLHAMQMAAGGDIIFNSNVVGIGDLHGEALGDIEYNSNNVMTDCGTGLTSDFDIEPSLEVTVPTGGLGLVL